MVSIFLTKLSWLKLTGFRVPLVAIVALSILQGCVSSPTHQAVLDVNAALRAENQRLKEQLGAVSLQVEQVEQVEEVEAPIATDVPALAQAHQGKDDGYRDWSTFEIRLGGFFSLNDSRFRIGTGAVGVDIDVEDVLNIDQSVAAWRVDTSWRYTENKKHRVDFSWFAIHRDKKRTLFRDIELGGDGSGTIIPLGTEVDSYVDLDVYQLAYSYSFIQDERLDLALNLGLYIMPIDFGVEAIGFAERETTEKFTAPMPVVGLRMDIALSYDWYFRSGFNVMYVEYDSYVGSIMQTNLALEYVPWDHWAVGFGYDTFNVTVEGDGDDDLNVDLEGKFSMKYTGLQLYGKYFY